MTRYWIICLLFIALGSCNGKENIEAQGAACLKQAREALMRGDCGEAFRAVDSLRRNFPMALNAREAGIVLKDSIEIESAKRRLWIIKQEAKRTERIGKELDSLREEHDDALQRIKFYRHKLKHDLANMKFHK